MKVEVDVLDSRSYGYCGRKATLQPTTSALVTRCPVSVRECMFLFASAVSMEARFPHRVGEDLSW